MNERTMNIDRLITSTRGEDCCPEELATVIASKDRFVLEVVYRDVPHERRVVTEAPVELLPFPTAERALAHIEMHFAIWGSMAIDIYELVLVVDLDTGIITGVPIPDVYFEDEN